MTNKQPMGAAHYPYKLTGKVSNAKSGKAMKKKK
jgi:hypothetical protein